MKLHSIHNMKACSVLVKSQSDKNTEGSNVTHFHLLTLTAIPYRSVEEEAAVGLVFGTLSVAVSEKWIISTGIERQRAQTCTILVCRPFQGKRETERGTGKYVRKV